FLILHPPPSPTLFPYTTLFRSLVDLVGVAVFGVDEGINALCEVRKEHVGAEEKRDPPARERRDNPPRDARDKEQRRPGCEHQRGDRKSTRLNSSHSQISYAVFC